VVEVFGAHGLIQRCREHKKRNVTDALLERLRAVTGSTSFRLAVRIIGMRLRVKTK
jgi:hypothetical protein